MRMLATRAKIHGVLLSGLHILLDTETLPCRSITFDDSPLGLVLLFFTLSLFAIIKRQEPTCITLHRFSLPFFFLYRVFSIGLIDLPLSESRVLLRSRSYAQKNPLAKNRHEQIST